MKILENVASVYIIKNDETQKIKIGFSTNVEKRLLSLENGAGIKLRILYSTKPIYDYSVVETIMHETFDKYRIFGEWFKMNEEEAICTLKELTKTSEVCKICKEFENGSNPTQISEKYNVSRTGIVKYLRNKGYKIQGYNKVKGSINSIQGLLTYEQQNKAENNTKQIKNKPIIQKNIKTESGRLTPNQIAAMVERNNKKIADKRNKQKNK